MKATVPTEKVVQKTRERKRRADSSVSQKKRKKEEEKENVLKSSTSSPSSSTSLSGVSRESSNSTNRRKNSKPLRLDQLQLTLPTCGFEELLSHYLNKGARNLRHFLLKNVKERKLLERKKVISSKLSGKKTICDVLPTMKKMMTNKAGEEVIFQLTSSKIKSWSNSLEATNDINSTSMIDLYSVLITSNDVPVVRFEGFSIVPICGDKQTDVFSKPLFETKNIVLKKQDMERAKYFFIATVATRMTAVGGTDEGHRRRTRTAVPVDTENVKYEKVVRFGCRLLYDKEKNMNHLHNGVQHIVLVNHEEDPLLGYMDHSSKNNVMKWMSDITHLQCADRSNRSHDNSHLPRLIISTAQPEEPDDSGDDSGDEREEDVLDSRGELKNQPNAQVQIKTDALDALCPFRSTLFRSLDELLFSLSARFPCFSIYNKILDYHDPNDPTLTLFDIFLCDVYFKELTVSKSNEVFYRPHSKRLFYKSNRGISDIFDVSLTSNDEPQWAPRNVAPEPYEKKFGLNFIQTPGYLPVISCVYQNRINPMVPPNFTNNYKVKEELIDSLDEECCTKKGGKRRKPIVERNEHYPLNNPKMYSDYLMLQKDHHTLVTLTDESKEMQVVESYVSREDTDDFNQKLSAISEKREKQTKKKLGLHPTTDGSEQRKQGQLVEGIDSEGRPIPTFAELFFPCGKNELYNIFLRFFYSETGNRPGYFSADWKSRVMTGLISKYHKYIFDNELDSLYKKQLQLIAQNTAGWRAEHHDMPMQMFREMKIEWKKNKTFKP